MNLVNPFSISRLTFNNYFERLLLNKTDCKMITSKATTHDTALFAEKFPGFLHKPLGKTGLTISASGFGAYRIDYRVREHFDSLEYAISSGINLIDTSANYSDGGSEILIGNVLAEMIKDNRLKREEIVIVTKGGYIQGKNLEHAKQKEAEGNPYSGVIEYSDNLWHCIHPDFISDQISDSLEKMKLETIDVYLLHNPEYFLDSPASKELSLEELRHEYYNRIKKAFGRLETEVDAGRISCYGISSNSFVYTEEDQTFTSLEFCLKAADEIKPDNHFYIIEFPFNLFEKGAFAKNHTAETQTLFELAAKNNLGVLINRPLNAIRDKRLNRIADFETNPEYLKLEPAQIITELNLLDSMEEDFLKEYLDILKLSEQNSEAVNYFLKAGQVLKENWKNFTSIENFNDVKKQFLIPRVNYAFTVILRSPNITDEMRTQLDAIARQINKLMEIIETIYGLMANTRSQALHKKLDKLVDESLYPDFKNLTLSQKAILLLNSVEEISCTLVGMRQRKYVDDIVGSLKMPVIAGAKEILGEIEM
jgi:aryl-alcohol dehydrogenase-like predicted oxidoreductase